MDIERKIEREKVWRRNGRIYFGSLRSWSPPPPPSNFVPILLELAVGNSRQTTTDPRQGDVDRSSKQLERVKGGRMGEDQLLGR